MNWSFFDRADDGWKRFKDKKLHFITKYIRLSLSGSMDKHSKLLRGSLMSLLVPSIVWRLVLLRPNDKFCMCIVPNWIYRPTMENLWMAHFLILRCLHRRPFRFLTLRPPNIIDRLDTVEHLWGGKKLFNIYKNCMLREFTMIVLHSKWAFQWNQRKSIEFSTEPNYIL